MFLESTVRADLVYSESRRVLSPVEVLLCVGENPTGVSCGFVMRTKHYSEQDQQAPVEQLYPKLCFSRICASGHCS